MKKIWDIPEENYAPKPDYSVKRVAGFYWVKNSNGEWVVAEYWINPKGDWACWMTTNDEGSYDNKFFEEINETPIVR